MNSPKNRTPLEEDVKKLESRMVAAEKEQLKIRNDLGNEIAKRAEDSSNVSELAKAVDTLSAQMQPLDDIRKSATSGLRLIRNTIFTIGATVLAAGICHWLGWI